jgi:polyamine oxidase
VWTHHSLTATYDYNGFKDYRDILNKSIDRTNQVLAVAGMSIGLFIFECSYVPQGGRVKAQQVDLNLQSAYGIIGAPPKNMYETACQYYEVDWVRE